MTGDDLPEDITLDDLVSGRVEVPPPETPRDHYIALSVELTLGSYGRMATTDETRRHLKEAAEALERAAEAESDG